MKTPAISYNARFINRGYAMCALLRMIIGPGCWLLFLVLTSQPDTAQGQHHAGENAGVSKVHFSWNYGFIAGGPAAGIKRALEKSGYGGTEFSLLNLFGFPSTHYPVKYRGGAALRISLDVDVMPFWRAGINYHRVTPIEIRGTSQVSETAYRRSWEFMMTWVRDPYVKGITGRSELALGIGLGINTLQVESYVPAYGYRGYLRAVKPGLALSLNFDTYIWKNLSLHFALQPRIIPSAKVKRSGDYEGIHAHKVNFSSVDSSIGLRLHF